MGMAHEGLDPIKTDHPTKKGTTPDRRLIEEKLREIKATRIAFSR